jgi:hypothetical protein
MTVQVIKQDRVSASGLLFTDAISVSVQGVYR